MRSKVHTKPFGNPKPHKNKSSGHRIQVHPVAFYAGFAALVATNIVTLVGFLMAPDIGKLFSGPNTSVLTAYEDRVSQLRLEVDRLQSRHYAQAGDINLQLQELAQQQEVLTEQHQYVKALADKAAELGIGPVAATANGASTGRPSRWFNESRASSAARPASVARRRRPISVASRMRISSCGVMPDGSRCTSTSRSAR